MADTLLSEKKSLTLDVYKGTDELEFIKQKVNTICRKGLDQFDGQYTRTKVWFKLDIEFLKTTLFLRVIQNSINHCLKKILKIKTKECIKRFCTV